LSVSELRDFTDAKLGCAQKMENSKKWNFWKMGKNKSGE